MAYERLWAKAQQSLTADGSLDGAIQVADTTGFFVKAYVSVSSNSLQPTTLQIKKIATEVAPYLIYLGPNDNNISTRTDMSSFLLADAAVIFQPEQQYSFMKPDDIWNATYERDPVKAWRVEPVDTKGNPIGPNNPLPVSATITAPPGTIPAKWDEIDETYDSNNNLITVKYYLASVLLVTLDLTYDSNSNNTKVTAS